MTNRPRPLPRILGASAVTLVGGTVMTAGQPAQAASFTVTNTNANGPGSLYAALLDAKNNPGADTITFDPSVTGTILLNQAYTGYYLPVINGDLTITGPGSSALTLDADDYICDVFSTYREYAKSYDANVTISGLTITNAYCDAIDITEDSSGGSSLTLNDVVIKYSDDNAVEADLGGSVSITNSTFTHNDSGIDLYGAQSVTIDNVTSSNNSRDGFEFDSDADWSDTVSITNSTFNDNGYSGIDGDDVDNLIVTNVTASDNKDYGLYVEGIGSVTVTGSTFDDNGYEGDGDGIKFSFATSATITSTQANSNYDDGIDLYAIDLVSLTNVTANTNYDNGLEFDSDEVWSSSISITDSTFNDNDDEGIDGDDVVVLSLTNVTANDNDDNGVQVQGIDSVTVTDSTFTGNYDDGLDLDGVYVSVAVTDVTASGNRDAGVQVEDIRGGSVTVTRLTANDNAYGLYIDYAADPSIETTIVDSTFDGNTNGVRVWLASADLERVTISNSTYDGIIGLGASITVVNSTVTSSGGAGIRLEGESRYTGSEQSPPYDPIFDYVGSDVTVSHSTITGNTGSGIAASDTFTQYVWFYNGPGDYGVNTYDIDLAQDITVDNSIVSGNGDVDIYNASENNAGDDQGTTTVTWSLVDEGSAHTGTGNVEADDPKLGALADNGGETLTMLPADDSPAMSAGNPSITGAPATDQRGVNRVVNRLEIGAVEVDADQGTITVLPPSGAGESTGITVPVTRSGAAEGPTSITLRSCDGVTRTLTWADGETGTKTATFPIPDNTTDDPDRTCTIEIVNRTGADPGTVASWSITVTDPEDSPAELPATGSSGALAWIAAALTGIGATMTRTTRRRTN